MLIKHKKINRLMFFDCKCKECRATRKSNSFLLSDGYPHSTAIEIKASNYADVIEYIESNAGWYTGINGAFKVAYIEEVVE